MAYVTDNLLWFVIAISGFFVALALLIAWRVEAVKNSLYRWPPLWRVIRTLMLLAIVYVLVILILLRFEYPKFFHPLLLAYLASLIGVLVGAGELIARYRDAPLSALGRAPSALYLAVNATAAGTAFLLINQFGWQFGFPVPEGTALDAIRVLVAGFGAMALFRSSLFLARIGDKDVGVGPATVLQVVLNAADAGVDRETAAIRAPRVKEIMQNVDPDRAKDLLPLFCFRLLQSSLPDDEFVALKTKIDEVFQSTPVAGQTIQDYKACSLGLIIMNYMGEDVLRAGVETLGQEIAR